jgi:hypothetical protein
LTKVWTSVSTPGVRLPSRFRIETGAPVLATPFEIRPMAMRPT